MPSKEKYFFFFSFCSSNLLDFQQWVFFVLTYHHHLFIFIPFHPHSLAATSSSLQCCPKVSNPSFIFILSIYTILQNFFAIKNIHNRPHWLSFREHSRLGSWTSLKLCRFLGGSTSLPLNLSSKFFISPLSFAFPLFSTLAASILLSREKVKSNWYFSKLLRP